MNEREEFPAAPTPQEHAASMREAIEAIRADQRAETGVVGIIPRAGAEYADEIDLTGKTAQAQRNRSTQLAQVKRRNAQRRANREAIQQFVAEGEYVDPEPTFRDLEQQVRDLADAERPEGAGPIRLLGGAQRMKNVTPVVTKVTPNDAEGDKAAANMRESLQGDKPAEADYRFLITAVRAAGETRPAPERYVPPRPNARTCTNRHGDPKAAFCSFDEAHEHAIGHTTERAHAYRCQEHGWHIGSNRPIPG